MDDSGRSSATVDALRLGLEPKQVQRFELTVELKPETLILQAEQGTEMPLIVCLHPPRFTEFQFAQKIRGLTDLHAHLAFPRGLHAHLVDLGGARTVGYDWCHYTGDNPSFRRSLETASEYVDRVMEQLFDRLPVDPRSIYILGAEGGALFASIYAVARSETFAGVMTIGGYLLPEVLADHMPEKRRIPFLCIHRHRGRTHRRDLSGPRVEELRRLGFPVDQEVLRGDFEAWQEEEAMILSWLHLKRGIGIDRETDEDGNFS